MIGELLLTTRQIAFVPSIVLEAIAIGTGPSFFAWIRRPLPVGQRYGCGVVTRWIQVDVYALGDIVHIAHAPLDGPVFATRQVRDAVGGESNWREFPEDELPHGGSSGGMALSLACRDHDVVGLIGFDGFGMNAEFQACFRELLRFWQSRGKRLVSLMPASAFDDLLLASVAV